MLTPPSYMDEVNMLSHFGAWVGGAIGSLVGGPAGTVIGAKIEKDNMENPEVNNRLEQEHSKPAEMRSYAAIISEMALAKKNPICEQALDEFMSIYGAEAGNLVLRYKALGGVYVAGNIALQNLEKLRDGTFMKAFRNKGRFHNFVGKVPVYVVLDTKVGLLGAAQRASKSFN